MKGMCNNMNKIYYSARLLLSRAGFSLLIILELALLLTAANIAQAQHNSRTMLYTPYAPYIEKQGFLCALPNPYYEQESVNTANINTLKNIPGATVLEQKIYSNKGLDIIVLPDDIFDSLRLPIRSGKLFNSNDNSETIKLIVTPDAKGYSQDTIISSGKSKNFEIDAVLTNPTYIPQFPYSVGMSYEDFYINYESEYFVQMPYFFTCESMMNNGGINLADINTSSIAMVCFDEDKSEEDYLALEKELNEMGISTIENRSIENRSRKVLDDDFNRRMPPVIVFSVIVLIGLVSCSLMITKSMMHKLTIFYCEGATKYDCLKISLLQTGILILFSGLLSAISLIIINNTLLSTKIGFVLRISNLEISGLIILICILVSSVAPILLISKADPHKLLTETSDE